MRLLTRSDLPDLVCVVRISTMLREQLMALITVAHYEHADLEMFRMGAMAPMFPFLTQNNDPVGISRDHLLEKWTRDCRITDIYEGTGEIQRLIIARGLLDYTRADLK